jgi:WD40 repeat protein
VWDIATGKELCKVNAGWDVEAIAFSPDGNFLALAARGCHVFRMSDGELHAQLGENLVLGLAFSPDGKFIATTGETVILWKGPKWKKFAEKPLGGFGKDVVFSKQGDELLVACDNTLTFFRLPTLEVTRSITTELNWIESIAVSPDGTLVACAGYSGVEWWDLKSATRIDAPIPPRKGPHDVAFSPNGRAFAVAGIHIGVDVWNLPTKEKRWSRSLRGEAYAVAFSPDNRLLAVGEEGKTVGLYNSRTGKPRFENVGDTGEVHNVRFCSDNRTLVSMGDRLRVWDVQTGKIRHDDASFDFSLATTHDSRDIIASRRDDSLRVWEVHSAGELVHLNGDIDCYALAPNGTSLVVSSKEQIAVIDIETGTARCNFGRKPRSLEFTPNSRFIISQDRPSLDGTIDFHFWDAANGTEVFAISAKENVSLVQISPDGRWVASVDRAARVQIRPTGGGRGYVFSESHGVDSVLFTPDSRHLLLSYSAQRCYPTGSNTDYELGHWLRLYVIDSKELVWEHETALRGCRLIGDGELFASLNCPEPQTPPMECVTLFRTLDGLPVASFGDPGNTVNEFDVSPDLTRIAIAPCVGYVGQQVSPTIPVYDTSGLLTIDARPAVAVRRSAFRRKR